MRRLKDFHFISSLHVLMFFNEPSKRFSCLNCAVGVDDKEGVVGEVGGGVQNSKDARDLSVCLKV